MRQFVMIELDGKLSISNIHNRCIFVTGLWLVNCDVMQPTGQ